MPTNFSHKIRIGTRASKLALIQADEVKNLLIATGITKEQIEIVPITTSGDKIQDASLADIGGKGLFIKELEESLVAKKIDIAIHCAKDVPPTIHQDTEIAAFGHRKDARDYFISQKYDSINSLPIGAIVGTSSSRRKSILLGLRPDLEIVNFRGNVDTRLKKIDENKVDATILAVCGLERLGKKIDQKNIIATKTMLPAVGQGCLAFQIRKQDGDIFKIVRKINHAESEICVVAEREFLRALNASCKSPVAVYCKIENGELNFQTAIFDFDGKEIFATNLCEKIDNFDGDFEKNFDEFLEKSKKMASVAAKETKQKAGVLLAKICS